MRTRNPNVGRAVDTTLGRNAARRAGSGPIRFVDANGNEALAWNVQVAGVVDLDDDTAQIVSESGGTFTNATGAALNRGDVVVIDGTTLVTTTTAQDTRPVGVVVVGGDDGEDIVVQTSGIVGLVNVTAAVTANYYAETSTTAKRATESSTRRAGSFGQYLTGGTSPTALLFGIPDSTGTGASSSTVNVSHLITGTTFPLIAHRGDINPVDGYPEDTLEAHRQAMVRGAHGIEFGVQRDADGTWQCFHDTTVDRTTNGTGAVSSKTTAQMAALNIDGGYGYNAGRHGTSLHPPTLQDVLDVVLEYDPIIMLNPKEGNLTQYPALAQHILDLGLIERVVILSPDSGGGDAARAVAPTVLTDNTMTLVDSDNVVSAAYVQGFEPRAVWAWAEVSTHYGDDETTIITDLWTYGARGFLTNDLPNALLIRKEVVEGLTGVTDFAGSVEAAGHYEVLMDGTGNPLDDGTGTDWLYVWVP